MNRLYKPLITVYRIGDEIFFSKDDAILYCKMNSDRTLEELETITLSRVSHEFSVWATNHARTIVTIDTNSERRSFYLSYTIDIPPYSLDLTLGELQNNSWKESHPYEEFVQWKKLIETLLKKGYHVKNGISPFQLYEHSSTYFSTKKDLDEYISKNPGDLTDYRTINLYPNASDDGKDIVVVEDVYAGNRVDRLHFIKQSGELGKYQYFDYSYPIYRADGSSAERLRRTELKWKKCAVLPEKFSEEKSFGGTSWVCNEPVAESTFRAIQNHHALLGVTSITVNSHHLFSYDGQFYTNFNDVFNRCKKDNKNLNETVRVYEYSSDVSATGAIKTYMYGDNAAECFAYCDENSYSRLGIDKNGEITVSEILDDSLDKVQTVFYYFMKQGLTPTITTECIEKYFLESSKKDLLKPLARVLSAKK